MVFDGTIHIQPSFLWTDVLIYILLLSIITFALWAAKYKHWREPWIRVCQRKLGMIAFVILIAYSLIALLDSIHFQIISQRDNTIANQSVQSLLDVLLRPLGEQQESTYSAPFALFSSVKTTTFDNGVAKSFYPRLNYAAPYLKNPADKTQDILKKAASGLAVGMLINLIIATVIIFFIARRQKLSFYRVFNWILKGRGGSTAWREILITLSVIILVASFIKSVSPYYHVFGTDKVGNDILFETIKSIRTGLVIGTLTTLVMLPFAILFGTEAGYFGGWRDDVIQYTYTTLSSVPAVLLISAAVLSLQVFIANHTSLFPTLESRADARLLSLCVILGITSWTSLCRLLRAETLKLREMDYVKAAYAMGVKNLKIIWRHIIPNVLHIILITVVLDFSALVLAEAVLSYVGVGVDPITPSWGNMINSGRLDLAREPVVWWPLLAAFIFMFILVLSANLFADAVRDAFDPRSRNEI